jgi:hypothetical protein
MKIGPLPETGADGVGVTEVRFHCPRRPTMDVNGQADVT